MGIDINPLMANDFAAEGIVGGDDGEAGCHSFEIHPAESFLRIGDETKSVTGSIVAGQISRFEMFDPAEIARESGQLGGSFARFFAVANQNIGSWDIFERPYHGEDIFVGRKGRDRQNNWVRQVKVEGLGASLGEWVGDIDDAGRRRDLAGWPAGSFGSQRHKKVGNSAQVVPVVETNPGAAEHDYARPGVGF